MVMCCKNVTAWRRKVNDLFIKLLLYKYFFIKDKMTVTYLLVFLSIKLNISYEVWLSFAKNFLKVTRVWHIKNRNEFEPT